MTIDVSEVPDGACTPLDPEATTAREPRYQRAIDAIRAILARRETLRGRRGSHPTCRDVTRECEKPASW